MYGVGAVEATASVADARSGATRVKSTFDRFSKGQLYLKAALEARDGVPEVTAKQVEKAEADQVKPEPTKEHVDLDVASQQGTQEEPSRVTVRSSREE
jgi:hypothetical protein